MRRSPSRLSCLDPGCQPPSPVRQSSCACQHFLLQFRAIPPFCFPLPFCLPLHPLAQWSNLETSFDSQARCRSSASDRASSSTISHDTSTRFLLSLCPSLILDQTSRHSKGFEIVRARSNDARSRASNLKLTVLLHDREDLDDDLGRRADEHLALSTALGVDDVVLEKSVRCVHHCRVSPIGRSGAFHFSQPHFPSLGPHGRCGASIFPTPAIGIPATLASTSLGPSIPCP